MTPSRRCNAQFPATPAAQFACLRSGVLPICLFLHNDYWKSIACWYIFILMKRFFYLFLFFNSLTFRLSGICVDADVQRISQLNFKIIHLCKYSLAIKTRLVSPHDVAGISALPWNLFRFRICAWLFSIPNILLHIW